MAVGEFRTRPQMIQTRGPARNHRQLSVRVAADRDRVDETFQEWERNALNATPTPRAANR
jgi:hypothetical protein